MAAYYLVNSDNPQRRSLNQVAQIIRDGGVVAYPTDSGFALGCALGNVHGMERMRQIRGLPASHNLTLVVNSFAQLGRYVQMDNHEFRAIKRATPGHYTFVLHATKDLPRAMQQPRKRTVGARVPDHTTALALLDALGEPLVSCSLILPGETSPLSDGRAVAEQLEHLVEAVLDSGDAGREPTTVIDFTTDETTVVRVGGGDPSPFE